MSRTRVDRRPASTRSRSSAQTIALVAGVLAVTAIAVIVALRGTGATVGRQRAPNVLLITIDTLRWDHVGVYGGKNVETPVIDGLAARGVRFETAIAHAPLTAPSHASILTGLIPVRHGVRDNGAFVLPVAVPTLATIFRAAGYSTAGFISGFPLERRFGFSNGFDTYDDRLPRGRGTRAGETERHADDTTARVLEWLGARADSPDRYRPWCMWIHYFDPHAAYEPPPEYLRKFATHPYDGEIAFADAQLGRVLDRLTATGDLANTIVLVTADHGESLGDHGEETHGVFIYDATLRVPWIVAGPHVPVGRVARPVARGVDVLPTLLDLAGVAVPALDGRSLRPALDGASMPDEPVYIESLLAARQFGWAALHGLRDARWKYIDAPAPELYDLAADATESMNLATEQADRARSLSRGLVAAMNTPGQDAASPVTTDTANRLRALGYIGASPKASQGSSSRDPKDHIALITKLEHAVADTRADPARAAVELRTVLAQDAAITVARRQLALALAASGDHRGVIEQVTTLKSGGAATAEDLLLLAESFRITGRAAEAARTIDEAGRMDPRSPEAPLTQARVLVSERRTEDAARAFHHALELAPDNPEALVGLGNLALTNGDVAGAASLFDRVLARDPSDRPARAGRALVLGRQGQMAQAIAILQQVVSEAPNDPQALAGLGAALARSGSPAAAVPYFERAVTAGLRTPAVLNGLGFAKLESGDRAGALATLRESLSIEPQQPGVQQAVRDLAAGGGVTPGPAR